MSDIQINNKVVLIPISIIKPYADNSKNHPETQIKILVKSIEQFGFNVPLVLDENNVIIAGHGRLLAAKKLKMLTVPCVILQGLDEAKKRQYRIMDNKSAESEWLFDKLKLDFNWLQENKQDLELTGFTLSEINGILGEDVTVKEIEADDVEEITTEIQVGDVFTIGKHKLMCGDSTKDENHNILVGDNFTILMVTDPPYGVNYDAQWRQDAADKGLINFGARATGLVTNDDIIDWSLSYKLFKGDVVYVWHAGKYSHIVAQNLEDLDFNIVSQIIWVKPHFSISRGDYHWQHEPCWYCVKKGKTHNWQGSRKDSTTWQIANGSFQGKGKLTEADEHTIHSTQKPIECMAKPIINNSSVGQGVYDPFGGSGSTMVACEQLNRVCYMMELEPKYCQVIINRMRKLNPTIEVKCTNRQITI
jgi:DNA modification methylase